MTKFSRDKGKRAERDMVEFFTKVSGVKYGRVPMSGAMHSFNASDIMKLEKKESIFDDVYIEVKDHKTLKVPEWIRQVEVGTSDMQMYNPKWVICMKHNHAWYFILNQEYFRKLNESQQTH